MERKEPTTKGGKLMYDVAKVILFTQWLVSMAGLFIWKDFPVWLCRPMAWIYWCAGCLALFGYIMSKMGLDDEYKG